MSSADPMIFSGDSLIFESSDMLAPSSTLRLTDELSVKHEEGQELSSHLPIYYGEDEASSNPQRGDTSPFDIHSAVLDSVFSSSADDAIAQDSTPMFDELDLIVDGAKINQKEDWVSLFGGDENPSVQESVSNKRSFSEIEETFEFAPMKAPCKDVASTSASPVLRIPALDLSKRDSEQSLKEKVDNLGCVTYAKKSRSSPLTPVITESGDPVSLKRARNTEAARRSRARKMERMSQLEDRVESLLTDKSLLESEVTRLKELLMVNGISF
ncbi:BZIP domain-containing protein [[Candida] zeylanoides]